MEITTKTIKGGTVILRSTERGEVVAEFNHPATGGKIIIARPAWGEISGQAGVVGSIKLGTKRQNVCLTIPRADWDAIHIARDEERTSRLATERIERGAVRALVFPHAEKAGLAWVALSGKPAGQKMDGSGAYGYYEIIGDVEPIDQGIGSLTAHTFVREHDRKNEGGLGNGYHIEPVYLVSEADEAELLGKVQAEEDAKIAAETARVEAEESKVATAKAEAAATGKPVEIRHFSCGCNDPREECDLDIVTEWAQPDGSVRVTRVHTW